jgi:hypothetical protein
MKKRQVKRGRPKKKKVSVIEILAVLIILVIGVFAARMGTITLTDEKHKREYIEYVNRYVDEAVKMYKNEEYRNNTKYFEKKKNAYIIKFLNIENVYIDQDPYGYDFMKEESNVIFDKDAIIVNVKSCSKEEEGVQRCYEIVDIDAKEIKTKNIKATIS